MPSPVMDVVVPAKDHAATLPELLNSLPTRVFRSVVVVDRASRDRTAEVARDAGALVLREPTGGYGAACLRAQAHFSALPRVPDILVFIPGDRAAAAPAVTAMITPIVERGAELVIGTDRERHRMRERVVLGLIDAVYRHRWASVGPVRALKFPALVALGMRDHGDGWDVEMLVRAVKLGLTTDEVVLPGDAHGSRAFGRALLHILRHSTMR
jgi:glycosyltransferase involved in cell wall biosynthesis